MSPDQRGRLSPGERALWLLHRLTPESGALNLAGAIRVPALDVPALLRALVRLVQRHPALRTTYHAEDAAGGEPVRRVHQYLEPDLREETLVNGRGGEALRQALEAEALRPFDPAAGPLLRVRIFTAPGSARAVLFVFDHLIADFGSLALILRELGAFYGEACGGAPAELGDDPPAYAAWVEERERELAGQRGERLRAFWRQALAHPPPALALPSDRLRPPLPSGAGHQWPVHLDSAQTARLLALGHARHATLFALLVAGLQLFLHRLADAPEVWIGAPASGRGAARWAGTAGYFVHPVVLRGRPGEAASFAALVDEARDEACGALAHRGLPLPVLIADLQPEREGRAPSLFQAMLTVHRTRHPEEEALALLALGEGEGRARFGGLTLETLPLRRRAAQLDLALAAAAVDGTLRLRLEMDADLFDAATAGRCASQLATLLAAAVASPEQPLDALPLLTEAERQQAVVEWGAGLPVPGGPGGVLFRFAAHAARAPEAPAILLEGRVVRTRGALLRRVARLAAKLAQAGTGPGVVVGLHLDRSPELVEAVLAVLASGAAYLPLDPAYPEAYLAHVLADSGVSLVLTREGLRARLPGIRDRLIVIPQDVGGELSDDDDDSPLPELQVDGSDAPDAPAYLLYTSGSTGRPKGIPIPHRSLAAYLDWVLEGPLAGIEGLPFLTSPGFDASLKQLFGPLLAGFPVRLIGEETARRADRLVEHLRGPGRLALNCVPSVWRAILDVLEAEVDRPCALVRLLLGGEQLDRPLLDRTFRRLPELEVWNLYGPTEATANAAAARLAPGEEISIGRPLRGARLVVVDRALRPLPPGAPGELLLGGTGVAPGYWRRPDLTAPRFVPDPFAAEPGARLYRSGDRARFRGDGTVELLGRIDRQLKVRGVRIEPAEIESALREHAAVADCAIGVGAGGEILIAWVVPRSDPPLTDALRQHLLARLPAAFVPAAFVLLDVLPRTPAGKVDRDALVARLEPSAAAAPTAPRTPLEEVVAGLWAAVLEVDVVGIHDDFLARGGHSLLASRLLSRVRNACGVDLPLRTLFTAPTVAQLAVAIDTARRQGGSRVVPPLAPAPGDQRHLLSFAQERLWFLDQWLPGTAAYNIPAAVRLEGLLDTRALAAALAEVVRRHEALRTTFGNVAGTPVQVIGEQASPLPFVDLAGLGPRGHTVAAALAAAEARRPFDLARGPLVRALVLRLGARQHDLVLNLHHIVADGWSVGVLVRELRVLYAAFREGRPSPLPPLELQYADFAAWQRRQAAGGSMARDLAWWRAFLKGAPAAIGLPADHARPSLSIHRGAAVPVRLGTDLTDRLRGLARRRGATLFMTLLAAFQMLLGKLTGAEDVMVGAAVDQRTPEVEGLIGLFVNLLPFRGDLAADPSFLEQLDRTRRVTLEAHDHRDVPFERLVAELEPVRDPGRNPLFQVAFSLLPALPELSFAGLTTRLVPLETGTARFDLTLMLREAVGGVSGILEYSAALFDATTGHRLLTGFTTLLAASADNPGCRLSRLPLLEEAQRHQLVLEASGGAPVRLPERRTLHQRFEEWAGRTPQAAAVAFDGVSLTYRQLDERANRLAHLLVEAGVRPGELVALWFERSLAMIVALLATLKAGAAYVPVDPDSPPERTAFALKDSGAGLLLVGDGVPEPVVPPGVRVVRTASWDTAFAGGPSSRLPAVDPDLPAYVIYTSGSTGRPKGVVVTHAHVDRLLNATASWFGFGSWDVWTLFHSYAFDFSVWEIWGALGWGGRLVVVPYWVSRSPVDLVRLLARERVTVLNQTPSAFRQLVWAEGSGFGGETAPLPALSLRLVILGGEAVEPESLRRWAARHGLDHPALVNMYGITETTVHVTGRFLAAADLEGGNRIGAPIPDMTLQVVDRGLEPQPLGVAGEVCVGGAGLAWGYLGRPELTAERFVPDPFTGVAGARLYRAGDLARRLPDGGVETLGRLDRQVKIRGFRVEPAEAEAVLARHPEVDACAVLPRGGEEDRHLVAWWVPARPPGPPAGELHTWCRDRLPAFLVPAAYVTMSVLPLDANGKLDVRALPEPQHEPPPAEWVAPRTPVEHRLAALWSEVLGIERVGALDDFFSLGGHSLLATRVVARIEREFGVEIELRTFFENPTLAATAEEVTRAQLRQGDPERMERLLARVRSLSPEELADFLREEAR